MIIKCGWYVICHTDFKLVVINIFTVAYTTARIGGVQVSKNEMQTHPCLVGFDVVGLPTYFLLNFIDCMCRFYPKAVCNRPTVLQNIAVFSAASRVRLGRLFA